MMRTLKRWLTPPVFENEAKTEQAHLLHMLVWALIFVPVPYLIYIVLLVPESLNRAIAQAVFGEVVNITVLILMRFGLVRGAAILQVSAFWFFFTLTAGTSTGVQGEAYLLGYSLVIAVAGMLLGTHGAVIFTSLCLIAGGWMVFEAAQGRIGTGFDNSALSTWIVSLILFPVGALLQYLGTRATRNALTRARASEEKYRLISSVSSDYTFSSELDAAGNVRSSWVAGAFESMTGYTYDEYLARGGWYAHLHPEDTEIDRTALSGLMVNKQSVHEVRTYTKTGDIRWVRVYAHPVWDETQNRLSAIVGAVQDITEQKFAEDRETQRREMLVKIVKLGQFVTEIQELPITLQRIWQSVRDELGFDRVGIFLYNSVDNTMNGTYGTTQHGEMLDESTLHISLDVSTSETRAFNSTLKDPEGLHLSHDYESEYEIPAGHIMMGVKDHAAVAARAGERPVAVICVDNVISGRAISAEQLEALQLFAGYAGLAIVNAQLNDALEEELKQQRHVEELESRRRTMLETVVQLGKQVTEVSDLKTTLERIWHGVHAELGFDRLAIFLYDQDSHSVRGTLGTDNHGQIVEEWDYERSLDQATPTSFTRALAQPDGVFLTHNFDVEHNIPTDHEMYGVKDFAAVTAWGGHKPVAIITVDNLPTKRPFTREQIEALRLFSGYAGLAIENARLNAAREDDLNQRKALIDELEARNAELERFTYTVSHDLKSPLVTITGFLGYLEQDALTGNTERVQSNIRRITGATKKMQALLSDLLELSRIGRLINPPESVHFSDIVHEAVDRVHGALDEINAILEIEINLPVVYGDRIRLVEVVQNLIENALKYSNPNVRPRIEIGAKPAHPNEMIFFVRDNGIGIAPEYHDTIFGLFNKLDPTIEGTGIGLTLVKRIIEVHGGQIWVESEPNHGTTFLFTLPTNPAKE